MTIPQDDQRFEQLVQKIAPQSKLRRIWPLKGGISAEMTAFEFERPTGQTRRMIVRRPSERTLKRNPHAARDEFKLLQITRSLGLATQHPYHLDQSGQIFSRPYLVIGYIEGEPEFAPANLADFTRRLATHLARIHQADYSTADLSFLPQPTQGVTNPFSKRPPTLDQSLAEGRIRETLAAAWPLAPRNAPALLHGDYWPGNILWQDGQLVAVIDWEDAHLGDPLTDFAISRLDLAWIFGLEAMHAFSQHYQALMYQALMTLDYAYLPYWDLYAALRLIRMASPHLAEWAAFFAPYGRHDITEQTMRADYQSFITQAFEKLAGR